MTGLEISKNDVYETWLKYDYVKEKLENHKDLKDLYNQVLWVDDKENKKIEDLSGVKTYLDSLKDKSWNDIKKEWATRSFAVQLFLKSQGLYNGRIDWLYMTAWQSESKTRAAVRKFQEANWLVVDGRAWSETIKKMLEKIDVKSANPELDMNKILENKEIFDAYKKLNPIFQWKFRTWWYVIETKEYSYKVVDKQLQRTNKPVGPMVIVEEVLLVDGKWWKKETPVNVPEKKIPEWVDDKKEKIKFTWSVDSRNNFDMMKYIEEKYKYKNGAFSYLFESKNFNFLKKSFLETNKTEIWKDPIVNAYMLYKAMENIWTNEDLVTRVFNHYDSDFKSLYEAFGKVKWETLIDWMVGDYKSKDSKKLAVDNLFEQYEKASARNSNEDMELLKLAIEKFGYTLK